MKNLISAVWWKAAGWRALRTVLVVLTPYAPTVLYDGNYLIALNVSLFAGLASLVTSLFGIAETTDQSVSWLWGLTERVVKTAAQALLTLFGTATMFQEVAWSQAPQLIGTAVLGSLLIAFLKGIPEAPIPAASAAFSTTVINPTTRRPEVASVPVVASVDVASSEVDGPAPVPDPNDIFD